MTPRGGDSRSRSELSADCGCSWVRWYYFRIRCYSSSISSSTLIVVFCCSADMPRRQLVLSWVIDSSSSNDMRLAEDIVWKVGVELCFDDFFDEAVVEHSEDDSCPSQWCLCWLMIPTRPNVLDLTLISVWTLNLSLWCGGDNSWRCSRWSLSSWYPWDIRYY